MILEGANALCQVFIIVSYLGINTSVQMKHHNRQMHNCRQCLGDRWAPETTKTGRYTAD